MTITATTIREILRSVDFSDDEPKRQRRGLQALKRAMETIVDLAVGGLTLTDGSVAFADSGGTITEDSAGLTFDATNDILFVGSKIRMGADDTDHEFSNATSGSGSTAVYIGNRQLIRASASPPSFTQTYATADPTLAGYTADVESSTYTATDPGDTPASADALRDDLVANTLPALYTDLNALRTAYENLRAFTEDLAAFTNSLVDELQTLGALA